jgi:membrane-bound serine protease (ClpP class)
MSMDRRQRRPRSERRPGTYRLSLILVALGWLLFATGSAAAAGPQVVVLPTTGIVDDGMASYLDNNIAQAESDGSVAVIVKLDTPGGSLSSTQDIVGTFLESRIPIIVWVAPAGGYAASAGTFITMASNIALMAPGTRIGAASPVDAQGQDITGTEGQKVKNDAIAWMTSIAQQRGRPVTWAVSTVQDASSYPAQDAVAAGAVQGMASTLDEVLAFADGKTVQTAAGPVTLDLAGATTTQRDMSPFLAFIRLLSDPTIAFLLFSAGSAGLLAELWSPNFVTGILGALALILAFIGLGSLPLNVGGLLLILLGVVLFGLELTVTSHGLLGAGGLVCFALGASALFAGPIDPFEPLVRVAIQVIIVATGTGALFLGFMVYGALRSRQVGLATPIVTTIAVGSHGKVRMPLAPVGSVVAGGEEWSARTPDGRSLGRGEPVRVIGVDGLLLTVVPEASSSEGVIDSPEGAVPGLRAARDG